MWWAAKQLLVPTNYVKIRYGESVFKSKIVYDFILPALLAVFTCAGAVCLGIPLVIFKHHEMSSRLLELLALMIVFYMAALAAVATFERKGIDDPLAGGDALLKVRCEETGDLIDRKLSYRQFISYLFGYLSFLSLCLYFALIFFSGAWPKIEDKLPDGSLVYCAVTNIVDPLMFFLIFFFIWQLFTTSLLGIYFLADRIQRLNRTQS